MEEPNDDDNFIASAWRKVRVIDDKKGKQLPTIEYARIVKKAKLEHNFRDAADLRARDASFYFAAMRVPEANAEFFKKSLAPADDRLEYQLNGKIIVIGNPTYDVKFLSNYSPEASTFKPRGDPDASSLGGPGRPPAPFRVFLGPSGSGKTFSALKTPVRGYTDDLQYPLSCTVYVNVPSIWRTDTEDSFGKLVVDAWKKEFGEKKLEMLVHVVFDEAGFTESDHANGKRGFGWTESELVGLAKTLEKEHELAEKVVISAAGTNLDKVLENVCSASARLVKFRGKPWVPDKVLGLVPRIRRAYQLAKETTDGKAVELVRKWIEEVPVFLALTGNGRAAVKLVVVLLGMYGAGRHPTDNIPEVVDTVARFYIGENGLKDLKRRERRQVVKAVLKVAMAADVETPVPVRFEFKDDMYKALCEKHCHGLVDSNVEKVGLINIYMDSEWKCPITISPCLAIVMFQLLGVATKLSSNWESFETVCALALIQETVIRTDNEDFNLINAKSPFPAGSAIYRCEVPLFGQHDVVLNGPRAPHGDGFGNHTIIQSKHSLERETIKCNLEDELRKSGLLQGDDDNQESGASVGAAVTALLVKQWKGEDTAALEQHSKSPGVLKESRPTRTIMYPASLMETNHKVSYNVIPIRQEKFWEERTVESDREGGSPLVEDKEVVKWMLGDEGDDQLEVPASFEPSITFAICTNGSSINLTLASKDEWKRMDPDYTDSQSIMEGPRVAPLNTFKLCPEHVDRNGALLAMDRIPELATKIDSFKKEGVDVRFRFCRGV